MARAATIIVVIIDLCSDIDTAAGAAAVGAAASAVIFTFATVVTNMAAAEGDDA